MSSITPTHPRLPGKPNLALVGATGAVGTVMVDLVSTREDVWGDVQLVASPRSAGRRIEVRGEEVEVQALSPEVFDGVDIAVFDLPDAVAAEYAPVAAERGAVVIDKSGAFRMNPDVPLVVPEVNPDAVAQRPLGVISTPNCTTLSMIVVIGALDRRYRVEELVVASYQAASGAGQEGIDTLYRQYERIAGDRTLGNSPGDVREAIGDDLGPFPAPLAMNVVPWAGSLKDDGWCSEEVKVRNESRKILDRPDLRVSATCVRVPVMRTHSLAIHARFAAEVDVDEVRKVLDDAPSVIVCDDPETATFPTPVDATGTDPTWVGRIRRSMDDPYALDMFCCGDNLRKGAALNAAQIAELVARQL